jgi:hypothetical protein
MHIPTCNSEQLEGAKNLDLLSMIMFENEILRRSAPQNDIKR